MPTDSNSQPYPSQQHSKPPSLETFTIVPAHTPPTTPQIKSLFQAYALSLNLDLSFQSFDAELASLPGAYHPDREGGLLLACLDRNSPEHRDGDGDKSEGEGSLGCIALRRLVDSSACPDGVKVGELKRLYVSPRARGLGVGRALVARVLEVAREMGYVEIKLDTLPSMAAAQGLYTEFGFVDVEKYCENPVEGVRWMGLKLGSQE